MTVPNSSLAALVATWLAAASAAQQHWSFVPPQRPPVPAVAAGWARNDIDRFVQALRETHGLVAPEKSARWWFELSRHADTHGMQRDQVRARWRWRDWVIDAYAANLPCDRFVTEQLVGDLLPAATLAQRTAWFVMASTLLSVDESLQRN